jgi:hypothetical protein
MTVKQIKQQHTGAVLNREQQSNVKGGFYAYETLASCSVPCGKEWKTRDCGQGVSCSTSGTTVYCGNDGGVNMCDPKN